MADTEKRRTELERRYAYLKNRLENIEDQLDDTPDPDWEENAVEHGGDEVLESLGESGLKEMEAIKAALKRIDAGTYGICVKCGEDIAEERLDVVPHTPLCRKCAGAGK